MFTVLSANFAKVSVTQTEFSCKLDYQTEPKTNKVKCLAKANLALHGLGSKCRFCLRVLLLKEKNKSFHVKHKFMI